MKIIAQTIRLFLAVSLAAPWVSAQTDSAPPSALVQQNGDLPSMIREAEKGVFFLRVKDAGGRVISSGTGFLVDDKASVATALHVIRQQTSSTVPVSVEAVSVTGEVCAVKGVFAEDERLDLVLLRLEKTPKDARPLTLGDDSLPERGSKVLVLGHPLEFRFVSSDGIISAVNKTSELPESFRKSGAIMTPEDVVWLQTSAPVSPGNSGGPMMDISGKVIGMIQWKARAGSGMNFALHISPLRKLLAKKERLVSYEEFVSGEIELNKVVMQFLKDRQKYAMTQQMEKHGNSVAGEVQSKDPPPAHPAVAAFPKLLEIARENSGREIEIRALSNLIMSASAMDDPSDVADTIAQACGRMIAGYSEDKMTLQLIKAMNGRILPQMHDFLRDLSSKSKDSEIRAVATYRLAQGLAADARTGPEREEVIRLTKAVVDAKSGTVIGRDSVENLANALMERTRHASIGCTAPELKGMTKDGVSVNLGELRGRHVVVTFWSKREFFGRTAQSLDSLERKFAGTPVSVVGVEMWDDGMGFEEPTPKTRNWPQLKDGEDQSIKEAWHIQSPPTAFLIDPKGTIIGRYDGNMPDSGAYTGYPSMLQNQSNWIRHLEKKIDSIPEIVAVRDQLRARLMASPWLSVGWDGTRERTVFLRDNGSTSVRWITHWEARPPSGLHLHVYKVGCVDLQIDFTTGNAQVTSPASIRSRTMRQRPLSEAGEDPESLKRLRERLSSGRWDFFENGMITMDEPRPLDLRADGTTSDPNLPAWEVLSTSRFRIYLHDGMFWTYHFDNESKIARSDMSPPDVGVNDGEIRSPKAIAMRGTMAKKDPDFSKVKAVYQGELSDRQGLQDHLFSPAKGRHVCIQIDSSINGLAFSALAELELLDENGDAIPNKEWRCDYAHTESSGKHWPGLAWDGNAQTFWHTPYVKQTAPYPHFMVIDMATTRVVGGIRIQQRTDHPNGRIKAFQLFVQEKEFQFK